MARVLVLVALAALFGQLNAAPIPKDGAKPPLKFPTQKGTKWVYTESGDRDAEATVSILQSDVTTEGARAVKIRYQSGWVANGATWGEIEVTTLWVDNEGVYETVAK